MAAWVVTAGNMKTLKFLIETRSKPFNLAHLVVSVGCALAWVSLPEEDFSWQPSQHSRPPVRHPPKDHTNCSQPDRKLLLQSNLTMVDSDFTVL